MACYVARKKLRCDGRIVELHVDLGSIDLPGVIDNRDIYKRIRPGVGIIRLGQRNEALRCLGGRNAQVINPMVVRDTAGRRAETEISRNRGKAEKIAIDRLAIVIEIKSAAFVNANHAINKSRAGAEIWHLVRGNEPISEPDIDCWSATIAAIECFENQ